MVLAPSNFLLDLADRYHLVPFILLVLFIGLVSTMAMAAKSCFRFFAEVVEAYYDFKIQCAASKERYQRALGKELLPQGAHAHRSGDASLHGDL